MSEILLTFGGVGCILGVGVMVFLAFAAHLSGTPVTSITKSPITTLTKREPHETFTNEEIMLPGVDVRRKNARKQIETSRELVRRGVTPAKYADHVYRQIERNRRLYSGDDVVDAEVVDEPKRLRGGDDQKLLRG